MSRKRQRVLVRQPERLFVVVGRQESRAFGAVRVMILVAGKIAAVVAAAVVERELAIDLAAEQG